MNGCIAIDPGDQQSALVVVDLDYRVICAIKDDNRKIKNMVRSFGPGDADFAIEGLQSYGKPVGQEVFRTAYWIGRFCEAAESNGFVPQRIYTRPKIFRALTGEAKGGDSAMRRALLMRFGGDKKGEPLHLLKGDGSDKRSAFAVAVYHLDGAKLGEW